MGGRAEGGLHADIAVGAEFDRRGGVEEAAVVDEAALADLQPDPTDEAAGPDVAGLGADPAGAVEQVTHGARGGHVRGQPVEKRVPEPLAQDLGAARRPGGAAGRRPAARSPGGSGAGRRVCSIGGVRINGIHAAIGIIRIYAVVRVDGVGRRVRRLGRIQRHGRHLLVRRPAD